MPNNNVKPLFYNRTVFWTKSSFSKRAIRIRKTGYFDSNAGHAPGGLYESSPERPLSHKNIRKNKKPIVYNIYKYTHYILFNNKHTSDKSIINLHSITNFQKFFKK